MRWPKVEFGTTLFKVSLDITEITARVQYVEQYHVENTSSGNMTFCNIGFYGHHRENSPASTPSVWLGEIPQETSESLLGKPATFYEKRDGILRPKITQKLTWDGPPLTIVDFPKNRFQEACLYRPIRDYRVKLVPYGKQDNPHSQRKHELEGF